MVEIHNLKPEDEKRLHPEAARWLNEWRAEIERDVPLEELSDDDLNSLLSDAERSELTKYKNEFTKELEICIDKVDASLDPATDITTKISLLEFKRNALTPFYNIMWRLQAAYDRKKAQKEEERRKREREERWRVASEAVNPPLDEAKRYLDDEEYDKFIQAALEAINVYLERGKDYLYDWRALDYRRSLEKIQYRKEEEQREREREQREREREQREREREERWNVACKAVNPPLDEAKRYLDNEEYKNFKQYALKAIDVYLEKGKDYLYDWRALDYRRSLEKIQRRKEEEQKEREREERRRVARKVVNPPLDEAKQYLDNEEYDKFIQAVRKAIDVYIEKGEDYLDDGGTFDYRWSLEKIQRRKEEERQKAAAESAAREYNQHLNKEATRLKALLCSNAKDIVSYFKEQIKDPRYTGQSFRQFLSNEKTYAFGSTIEDIGARKLDEIVSSKFRQFFNEECRISYFLLPSAKYRLEGVPCLSFMFHVFAVVEVRVWLEPGQKDFGYYTFELPWREEGGRPSLLQKPEFLGYHYIVLTPKDLNGYIFWQSIPLVLLKGLLNGETKPTGTIISAATVGMVAYKIPKFKEEVTIPDSFASYLKNIGSIDRMVSMGIITEKVGSIVKSVLSEFETERGASPLEERIKRKGTKKAKAFQLFSEGKGPDNPEVKALGMHKSTRYKYYKQYLATHKP